jgi:hypothetical protein
MSGPTCLPKLAKADSILMLPTPLKLRFCRPIINEQDPIRQRVLIQEIVPGKPALGRVECWQPSPSSRAISRRGARRSWIR